MRPNAFQTQVSAWPLLSFMLMACGPSAGLAASAARARGDAMDVVAAGQDAAGVDVEPPRLRTHDDLRAELAVIERLSRGRLRAGPLVRNGANGGLVDLDVPVADVLPAAAGVCGAGRSPSLREAVTCTIEPGSRGTTSRASMGRSGPSRPRRSWRPRWRSGPPTGSTCTATS